MLKLIFKNTKRNTNTICSGRLNMALIKKHRYLRSVKAPPLRGRALIRGEVTLPQLMSHLWEEVNHVFVANTGVAVA